jgi:hypothetical protein
VLALSALLVAIGLRAETPPPIVGVVGAVALLGARYRLLTPYVLAVGQTAIVAANGTATPAGLTIAAEVLLVGGLALPAGWSARGRRIAVGAAVGIVLVGGVTLGSFLAWERIWATALVAVGTGGLMGYALHRYEQVRLQVIPSE